MRDAAIEQLHTVLDRYALGDLVRTGPLGDGLINDTFAVDTSNARFVCQRVHEVFAPEIHHNIAAVTEHLASRGVPTPRLVPATDGASYVEHQGRTWRLMTRLPGVSFNAARGSVQARAAAAALARFHSELDDLDHRFVGLRSGVHDTAAHLANLEAALTEFPDHRLRDEVFPLAEEILGAGVRLPELGGVRSRIAHGDPKFNNILFAADEGEGSERAVGLIDLDTVAPLAIHLELGDAWRSWCNPKGEDDGSAQFDLATFEASLEGWASAVSFGLDSEEVEALTFGVEIITVELAARFCADALAERYFGWSPEAFASRGEHNLVRARGQWALHRAALDCRAAREKLLRGALGRV